MFFILLVLFMAGNSYGVTPAGTIIRSQAQATFLDLYGERQQATSNEVQTLIQAVPGIDLQQDQTRYAAPGGDFVFPHVLTNTGNVAAKYKLSVPEKGGSQEVRIYRDDNHDGQINNESEVSDTVSLAAGEAFYFLVNGKAPDKTGDRTLVVEASVQKDSKKYIVTNTDTLKVFRGVMYRVTKGMDKIEARADEDVLISFRYQRLNNKKKKKTELVITDVLPLAMQLESFESAEICDADEKKCVHIKDLAEDQKENIKHSISDDRREIKLTLTHGVDSPESDGVIRFKVKIQNNFSGQTVFNQATYQHKVWLDKDKLWGKLRPKQTTNRVPLFINGLGVTINGSRYSSAKDLGEPVAPKEGAIAKPGSELTFINYLWNTGTEITSYTVSFDTADSDFPGGTLFWRKSEKGADTAPIMKGEKNEQLKITVDDLSPGEFKKILLKVKLPENIEIKSDKKGYEAKLKAEVKGNSAVTDEVVNKLPFISDNRASVDLTLGSALQTDKNATGLGSDTDPEAKPAIIQADGAVIIDKVFVNNTGGVADSYNLSFTGKALPDGFNLTFYDAESNVPLANTGVIAADGKGKDKKSYKELKLKVSVPVGITPDEYKFTIKALSPVTGAEDTLPLSVEVVKNSGLTLEPNGEGQVMPGSFITFAHRLTNTGNTNITDITLSWSDSSEGKGWQSVVYRREQASEKDNIDGSADLLSSDEIIQSGTSLAVDPGKTTILIVKVFAPANAMQGAKNITEVKASWVDDNGVNELIVTDTATVNNTNVVIIKKQAAWDCKSDPLKGRQFITTQFPVKPGHCVVYKLTATNRGAETVSHVVIHDAAPNFTVFVKKYGLPKTDNVSSKLYDDDGRIIKAEWSELSPGASVSLYFGIQIQ
ncbi:hypothetical protein [Endozoicomonas sp. Mp262]|uniref:COG1470 family protein n=1 Tax=Endozoicomonas sp. Mp262 TaxID=2919499 RepID=UPI0021DB2080